MARTRRIRDLDQAPPRVAIGRGRRGFDLVLMGAGGGLLLLAAALAALLQVTGTTSAGNLTTMLATGSTGVALISLGVAITSLRHLVTW